MHIASKIGTTTTTSDSGKAHEHGSFLALFGEKRGRGEVGEVAVGDEDTMGTGATGMHGAFGNLHS